MSEIVWADVRSVTVVEDLGLPASTLVLMRKLLRDADALLVLRGTLLRMSHMIDSGGTWDAVDAAVMHEMAESALAALPEHLRVASDLDAAVHSPSCFALGEIDVGQERHCTCGLSQS